jgi:beta-lactamase regulating signal transducer with metallopeptidase domain
MNSMVLTLNQWSGQFLNFLWPMLWQSSLLIVTLFVADILFRRKIRASIRYALWLVVLVKLCLPPALALPTSPAWWLQKTPPTAAALTHYTIVYDSQPLPEISQNSVPACVPPRPVITAAAWGFIAYNVVGGLLLVWLLARWWQVARRVRRSKYSEKLTAILNETRSLAGVKSSAVPVKLTDNSISPAVCGLFQPVILIPQSLAENFSDEQLRVVLLHELIHLRRGDVWLNFLQTLLQIVYWWHPLVWLANARIRRVREEAVDDAVMLALHDEAESYAPTLLEVAKLALTRPLASLGLVGILESRSALRQRIERLVNFRPPPKAGLTLVSLLGIAAFSVVAVPMGAAPSEIADETSPSTSGDLNQANWSVPVPPDSFHDSDANQNLVATAFKIDHPVEENTLRKLFWGAGVKTPPTVFVYRNNGILFVRSSREQLELVRRVVLKLNGFTAEQIKTSNKQYIKQTDITGSGEQTTTNLLNRTFKIDAYQFTDALRNIPDLQTNGIWAMAKSLFAKFGVDWESPKGKEIFYDNRLGWLFVRATKSDLDTIEGAIAALDSVAPQIHIKARFLEMPKEEVEGFRKTIGVTNQLVGILTGQNEALALQMLESSPGVEELAAPEVTTISGGQVEMRATIVQTIITNFAFQEISNVSTVFPQTNAVETGPVLNIIPIVLADDYTIDLSATASLKEFLGYDKITNTIAAYNKAGQKVDLPTISPSFEVRKASAHIKLWDGQTLVLGLKNHFYDAGKEVVAEPDYFKETDEARGQPNEEDKNILVFITATLVDSAGNRIHSDADLPFAQKGIPPQNGP